ncbi:MAG: hypothetical protein AB7I50_01135 [Vicinamibacterales bacterium]
MRIWGGLALGLAMATTAFAAPNVTNFTQKGSLLYFADIRIDQGAQGPWNTLVRIQNDGNSDIDVKCYWMDGNKNRLDFVLPLTANQAVWFDARTGRGTYQVNPFPQAQANGFPAANQNPFLNPPTGPYFKGLLVCWAIDNQELKQIKWNHLSGTATVSNAGRNSAYEYAANAFFAPSGADLGQVGATPGRLNLNGLDYDACPLYLIGQFSPVGAVPPVPAAPSPSELRLVTAACTLDLRQDWVPTWSKLQFDIWNEEEVKFTGAYECADSWHESPLAPGQNSHPGVGIAFYDGVDAGGQAFLFGTLGTYAARYRVQAVKSTQCDWLKPTSGPGSQFSGVATSAYGLIGIQYTDFNQAVGGPVIIRGGGGTPLAAAGKFNGTIRWDVEFVTPEGGVQ